MRQGFLAVQFERLVSGIESRTITLDTAVGRFALTRHDNVVVCACRLAEDDEDGAAALKRRGAVDEVFMISPKLPPKEFGLWLDRLLVDDLGAQAESSVVVLALDALVSSHS